MRLVELAGVLLAALRTYFRVVMLVLSVIAALFILANVYLGVGEMSSATSESYPEGEMRSGGKLWGELYGPNTRDPGEREAWRKKIDAYAKIEEIARRSPATLAEELKWAYPELPPVQPLPPSGTFFGGHPRPRTEPFVVDATRMKSDIQVVLGEYYRSVGRVGRILSFVVRRGEKVEVQIPEGIYNVLVVTGPLWLGERYGLFLGGVGRYVAGELQFGGEEKKIVFGSRTAEVEKRRKTVGYDLVLLPYRNDFPGFERAMMKRLKTE